MNRGGVIVYEKDGHGLVAAPTDLGRMTWADAGYGCDELTLNGYSGCRLPTKEELKQLYLNKDKIGGFAHSGGVCGDYVLNSQCIYWSSAATIMDMRGSRTSVMAYRAGPARRVKYLGCEDFLTIYQFYYFYKPLTLTFV